MTLKHVHKITIYYLLHHPIQKWGKGEGGGGNVGTSAPPVKFLGQVRPSLHFNHSFNIFALLIIHTRELPLLIFLTFLITCLTHLFLIGLCFPRFGMRKAYEWDNKPLNIKCLILLLVLFASLKLLFRCAWHGL